MRVPDPIEIAEARMDRWAETHIDGDQFLCDGCGKWYPIDAGVAATPDPYSPPICSNCACQSLGEQP